MDRAIHFLNNQGQKSVWFRVMVRVRVICIKFYFTELSFDESAIGDQTPLVLKEHPLYFLCEA